MECETPDSASEDIINSKLKKSTSINFKQTSASKSPFIQVLLLNSISKSSKLSNQSRFQKARKCASSVTVPKKHQPKRVLNLEEDGYQR